MIADEIISIQNVTARDVLALLIDRSIGERSNRLVIERAQRNIMARRISIARSRGDCRPEVLKDRAILNALSVLVDADFIQRYAKGKYEINPDFYYYGTTFEQENKAEIYIESRIRQRTEAA